MHTTEINLKLDESRYIIDQYVTGNYLVIRFSSTNEYPKEEILIYDVTTGVQIGVFNLK